MVFGTKSLLIFHSLEKFLVWKVESLKKVRDRENGYSYYDNGQLWTKKNYKDGKRGGLFESFYSDGELVYKGNYKDGEKNGLWKCFNEDGSLRRTETWKNEVLK